MTNFQDIINNVDLDETRDEFFENETVVESVDADGMVAIIETIVGTATQNNNNPQDESERLKNLSDNLTANDDPSDEAAFKINTENTPTNPPTASAPEAKTTNSQQNADPAKPAATVKQTTEQKPQATIGLFEQKFPKIVERIKIRFNNAPDDFEKLMKFLNKKNVVNKVSEELEKIGNEPVMIDHKAVGALVKFYNNNNKVKIALPFRNAEINDKSNPDLQVISNLKLPKGFNNPPTALGERCTSTRFGYPFINFGSETVREMLKPASDLEYLKTLTKEFVKEIKNTPIAEALGTRTLLGTWKQIVKRVRICGRSKCIPAVHKPLKVTGGDNIEDLFRDIQSEDGVNMVSVSPINTRSSQITESVDSMPCDAMMEGLTEFKSNIPSNKKDYIDEPEIEVPIPYLAQYYQVSKPSSTEGMEKYTRYMSADDMKNILANISEEAASAAKQSNTSYKSALLVAYAKEHDGILPYYILTQRNEPKERIRITPKPLLHGLYFVKSVDGPNRATGYFISKDEREQLFELG